MIAYRLALAVLAAVWTAQAAAAPATVPRRMLDPREQLEWRGVGRLNIENGGYCTATLLSETLAITAAHCLFDDMRRRSDTELWFAAGFRNGKWEALRQARRSAVHPDYQSSPGKRASREQVAADIALIELDAPVFGGIIPNYPAAPLPDMGGAVALLSYGRGRSEALSLQEPCRVEARRGAIVRLTCEVVSGSSGSPVFRRGAGGAPELVAVISGMNADASFAVVLEDALGPLRAALIAQGPRRKVVSGAGEAIAAPPAPAAAGWRDRVRSLLAAPAQAPAGAPAEASAQAPAGSVAARSSGAVRRVTPDDDAASGAPRVQGGGAWNAVRPPSE
ncbi:MAG: protease YdgD [Paracoccaceae bacterium]|jgi:protease YdgD